MYIIQKKKISALDIFITKIFYLNTAMNRNGFDRFKKVYTLTIMCHNNEKIMYTTYNARLGHVLLRRFRRSAKSKQLIKMKLVTVVLLFWFQTRVYLYRKPHKSSRSTCNNVRSKVLCRRIKKMIE